MQEGFVEAVLARVFRDGTGRIADSRMIGAKLLRGGVADRSTRALPHAYAYAYGSGRASHSYYDRQ
jgi:hypothetical protein